MERAYDTTGGFVRGAFEQIYGYGRAVRVGGQVHVAGTAARGEALRSRLLAEDADPDCRD
jgi:hypothetical protein